MNAIKEKILGAVTVMNDEDAQEFWEIILEKFVPADWADIEEVEPDDIDLQMLADIESDPDCHEFTNENDIDWESKNLLT